MKVFRLYRFWAAALVLGALLGIHPSARSQDAGQESSADEGKRKVKSKVEPEYPDLARQMKLIGKVKIEATITADGRVSNTKVIGGNPVFVNAAIDALKKWKFEPAPKETTQVLEFEFGAPGS